MWRSVRAALVSLVASMLAFACGSFGTDRGDSPDAAPPSSGEGSITEGGDSQPGIHDSGGSSNGDSGKEGGSGTNERFVFTTSQSFNGNLGGLDGADAKCNLAAASQTKFPALKQVKFKAWLSTAARPANTRLDTTPARKFKRPGGMIVANSWAEFAGSHKDKSTLDVDENGAIVSGEDRVWTGTAMDGTYAFPNGGGNTGNSCSSWTSAVGDSAIVGDPDDIVNDGRWTDAGGHSCGNVAHLYCIEE